jgi:hypothetical protein
LRGLSSLRVFRAARSAQRRGVAQHDGIPEADTLQRARATIAPVAQGRGGRNASARLQAANFVLSKEFLPYLSDEAMLYEVRRRTEALGRRVERSIGSHSELGAS